jgi:hypothetical protein
MLNYQTVGPRADGRYLVAYCTPGCLVWTSACDCSTEQQAAQEAARLNREQIRREEWIRRERELCGMTGVYPDLEK